MVVNSFKEAVRHGMVVGVPTYYIYYVIKTTQPSFWWKLVLFNEGSSGGVTTNCH